MRDSFRRMLRGAMPFLFAGAIFAADVKEEPVGLMMSPGGAKVLRAGTETPLDARSGDLLFSGDGIRTGAGPATFVFCPAKALQSLTAAGEIHFEAKQIRVKTGQVSVQKPVASCFLPQVVRVAVASQQHYGVSMTRGVDSSAVPPVPHDKLPADLQQALAPLDEAVKADPGDLSALAAIATLFENHNLPSNALEQYQKLRAVVPDATWVQAKIFDLQQAVISAQAAATASATGGDTYALLVGVSQYKNKELSLQYAERDASTFDKLLLSPRGGGIPPGNILLLTDEKATTAAVRNGFQDFLKRRAKKGDTVIIMIAGHGTVEVPGSKNAFILTYDSDPQDLNSTALPMAELQSLFQEQLNKVGHVVLFVDVCKSGTIGSIKNTSINSEVQQLGESDGDLLGLMASRPRELSLEGPQFGGGHGVFSYFVLKGLEGAADADKDGKVDASELIKYVSDQVATASDNKQHPREFGNYDGAMRLSDVSKPGIELSLRPAVVDPRSGETLYLAAADSQAETLTPRATQAVDQFEEALRAGHVLPQEPGSAFTALNALKPILTPERYEDRENELRVALEDRAQNVLLEYLTGDQVPQVRGEFEKGAQWTDAALQLTPESMYLQGHEDFFKGRALLFEHKYAEAAILLESAVRIDPNAGYAFNALGIAYLEQAQYDKAVPAFRDAARRAQHWSYPLHNLALAYMELGNYNGAIKAYEDAIRLAPQYSYLPYNLGFVYQRIGRHKDAEAAYRKAHDLAPDSPAPLSALGSLEAAENKFAQAERSYRMALDKDPKYLAARHNLAVLLAGRPGRLPEAIRLWQENLTQAPDYINSRLALARAFESDKQVDAAREQFRQILQSRPDYTAARLELAAISVRAGQKDQALSELREALKQAPDDPQIYIRIGDIEAASGNNAEAREAFTSALQYATDSALRKQIQKKLGK